MDYKIEGNRVIFESKLNAETAFVAVDVAYKGVTTYWDIGCTVTILYGDFTDEEIEMGTTIWVEELERLITEGYI